MKTYRMLPGAGLSSLASMEETAPMLGPQDVRVRVRAVTLNYRDLLIAQRPANDARPTIPTSDGAGEVVALGSEVGRFALGDRVVGSFFPAWIEGPTSFDKTRLAFGGSIDGWLAEEVVVDASALVRIPEALSYVEAASLPCAGVTAWNALFQTAPLTPGDSVLLLGTGGVSIAALQLARAAGLTTIVTSSSAAKLERVRALGADHVIDYGATPAWEKEVLRITEGRGVDRVLEIGGEGTLLRSVAATRYGGSVAMIGGVTGFGGGVAPGVLISQSKSLLGIYVGSREHLASLARFVAARSIAPVIDRVFAFDEAREAFAHLEGGSHLGKVAIALP